MAKPRKTLRKREAAKPGCTRPYAEMMEFFRSFFAERGTAHSN